jgi:type I restriction enzyme S subunit
MNNYPTKTLGEICETTSGGTPSRGNSSFYNGSIPWVKSGELNKGVIYDTEEKISEEAIKNSSAKIFPKGTLLIALYGATIGKLAFLGVDAATNQAVCGIYQNEKIESKYLYNYLFHKKQDLVKQGIGGAQPNISQTILKKLEIPLPDLTTQQAIVSKIEELFSDLDKGLEDLKKAQQQLKTFRQSVLKWAFEGKLTNENVKEGKLPKGWEWVKIDDIAKVGTGSTPLKGNKDYYENGKIAWVTSGALNDEYVRKATDYVTDLALKETNLSLYPKHTLLLAMYGEGKTRGKCSELLIEATTNQAIAAISFENHDIRVKPFLKYFLLKNYNDLRLLSSGGVQPNLNLGIVKNTKFPFPSLEEQQRIVQEIESRLSVADKMEEGISQSIQKAESLRQSILKKAFSGELV